MEESTKRRLLSRGLLAPDNWLNTCTDNFRSSNEYAPGQDKLEEYVFQQWLLVDLGELGVRSFPPDLENQLKVTLDGCYTCQIVSVIDTGHSAYSQYQKIRSEDIENLAVDTDRDTFQRQWEPKSSRTLLLSLTDGTQELVAMEVQRIATLSINLMPGCKTVIKGPVTCRRGHIMLERQSHIELLGGKIESFLIPNAYENILGLNLGVPVNKNARIATGEALNGLMNEGQENEVARRNGNHVTGNYQPHFQRIQAPQRAPVQQRRPTAPLQRTEETRVSSNRNIQQAEDDYLDDDALLSIDLDNVMALEVQEGNIDLSSGPLPGQSAGRVDAAGQSRPKIDSGREPDVSCPRSNKPLSKPTTPTYAMDVDEELLNEFANDLGEAYFSQPGSSSTISENSQKESKTLEKSGKSSGAVGNSGLTKKASQSLVKPSLTIDSWFKTNRTTDSETRTTASSVRTAATTGNPSRNFFNSPVSSSRIFSSGSLRNPPAQKQAAPVSQDSGCPDEEDDSVWQDDEGSTSLYHINVETLSKVVNKPQRHMMENARHLETVPTKLADASADANISEERYDVTDETHVTGNVRQPETVVTKLGDVVKDILEGKYGQEKKVEVKVKIRRTVENLRIKDTMWAMVVEISDDSAVLEVSLSSEAITKMIGITPVEGAKKRKEAITNPAVKEELKMAFGRLEKTLKRLDCIVGVIINPGRRPCVVNIQV